MMTLRILTIAAMLLPALAHADDMAPRSYQCTFTSECIDSDCADTSYDAEFKMAYQTPTADAPGTPVTFTFDDVAQSLAGTGTLLAETHYLDFSDFGDETGNLRSAVIAASGDIRFVTIMGDGPMTLHYAGTCEAQS